MFTIVIIVMLIMKAIVIITAVMVTMMVIVSTVVDLSEGTQDMVALYKLPPPPPSRLKLNSNKARLTNVKTVY